ncbi:isatin hydrolase-like, partial [Homalodisca vitripennis]|uniref:isatin hydrolase-like n=1 Tax=Homalodisca vitripennis TaxID=197043 RepID=UPI001EECEE15
FAGVVINKQEAAAADADTQVTVQDLLEWEEANGELPDPVAVIFDFGWAKKYPNRTEYFGIVNGNESDIHFPGVSEDAAHWLVSTGKVVGVGVDTPSIDPGSNKEFMAHRILTAADIYLMENLALDGAELPARGFQLTVMPMKIVNGTGAPLRIFARPITPSFFSMIFSWIIHPFVIIGNSFKRDNTTTTY